MDPRVREAALAYAADRYPDAELVVVAGSAADERRPRSDIDLLVLGPAPMFPAGAIEAAHTERWGGELFEVLAATEEAFRAHAERGARRFRPVSTRMLVEGVVVLDRGRHDDLVRWTTALMAAGPDVSRQELDLRRYGVTCTLDDLLDATDPAERAVLAATLFERLGEFLLLADGRWIGSGRWLLRLLRAQDAANAAALGAALAATDVAGLERLALAGLEPHGGRLLDGFVRS